MNANSIQVGRVVNYFGGYGAIDGLGAIVKVHGTPNLEPRREGLLQVIRRDDCRIDVILFDGRRINDVHQVSIDRPGIGIKLIDEMVGPEVVEALPAVAAKRDADLALAAILEGWQ